MGASSRNHACRMSGLIVPTSWIMRTFLRIVLVFQTEKLVCLVAGAVGGKPPSGPGAGNENIC